MATGRIGRSVDETLDIVTQTAGIDRGEHHQEYAGRSASSDSEH